MEMTVKELIEKLKEFDEDREVLAYTQDGAYYEVEKVISNDSTLEEQNDRLLQRVRDMEKLNKQKCIDLFMQ